MVQRPVEAHSGVDFEEFDLILAYFEELLKSGALVCTHEHYSLPKVGMASSVESESLIDYSSSVARVANFELRWSFYTAYRIG